MSRKYIKNCTGPQCEMEKANSHNFGIIIFYFLVVCFVAVFIYVIFFSQYLMVSNITISGTQTLDSNQLRQNIENSFQGKFLGIIPRDNFLFISQDKIQSILTENFKKIRSVAITRKFPDTLNISIDERKALLVWCSNEKCYLLDEQGIAYSEADFSSPELVQNNLLQITDNSGKEVSIGEKVIEPAYQQYVSSIKDALSPLGFNATGEYWTPSRMAEEINVKTEQETEFYFSTQFTLESAMRTLNTVFKKEITQDQKSNIAYIDLRNENKVFYKLKNALPVVENPLAATTPDAKKDEKKK